MQQEEFIIIKEEGVHARPASIIVKLAHKFSSNITLEKDGQQVNCKSIMGILELTITCGSTVIIKADGEDEKEAIEAIASLFKKENLI